MAFLWFIVTQVLGLAQGISRAVTFQFGGASQNFINSDTFVSELVMLFLVIALFGLGLYVWENQQQEGRQVY